MEKKENSIRIEETPWSELAVIICSKCQTLFEPGQLQMDGNVADQLKNTYKKKLKDEGLSEKCRVMVSGCQHVCLSNRQSVSFFPKKSGNENQTITITMHPDMDQDAVFKMIKDVVAAT
jgi:hypothetical protein